MADKQPTTPVREPLAGDTALSHRIDALTRVGDLYENLADGKVRCLACAHRCKISPGGRGVCQVRYHHDGRLYVPWGYTASIGCDPIEKKPFYHVFPGALTLTFGMLGCDMRCPYCQNWNISQALRDAAAGTDPVEITPRRLVDLALRWGARCVVSSYNEPLITAEWAADIFKQAKAAGLATLVVSNGNATPEALDYLRPHTDAYKIDLKTLNAANYRQLGAVLEHILDGIRMVHERGFWLEIVTLLVPGFNDSDAEVRDMARFIRSVSPDIPWHVTAFHPDYRMREPASTSARALIHAVEIGYAEGLRYVYAGNRPGQVGMYEHTSCPACQLPLVERLGFHVLANRLTETGACPRCQTPIPGMWRRAA